MIGTVLFSEVMEMKCLTVYGGASEKTPEDLMLELSVFFTYIYCLFIMYIEKSIK